MRHPLRTVLGACVLIAVAAYLDSCAGAPRPAPPTPVEGCADSMPAQIDSTYVGRGFIHHPADVRITQLASLRHARFMVQASDDVLFVSTGEHGTIGRITVQAGGAVAIDSLRMAGDGIDTDSLFYPNGLAIRRLGVGSSDSATWLYVATARSIRRIRLRPPAFDTVGSFETVLALPFKPGPAPTTGPADWHAMRQVVFGADSLLYVSISSSSDDGHDAALRGTIVRLEPGESSLAVVALGLRSISKMVVHPGTKEIWLTVNERNAFLDNAPPDEINVLKVGRHYGWPECYGDRIVMPEGAAPTRSETAVCAATEPPILRLDAHAAPLGFDFLANATRLPSRFRGEMLVALHGSGRELEDRFNPHREPRVIRVRISGRTLTSCGDFMRGWRVADTAWWGRPVDVLVTRDGAVLVSDDSVGIYRVEARH
jgi:glucose/arabinose dehydrogenase